MGYISNSRSKHGFCNEIEVTIEVQAYAEDDYGYEVIQVYDKTEGSIIDLTEFPDKERREIDKLAEELAANNAYDVWIEACICKADFEYDRMKEEGW